MVASCSRAVIQFNAPYLGALLADAFSVPLVSANIVRFADTECDVVLDSTFEGLQGKSVFLVAQLGGNFAAWSVNDFVLSLCFLASKIRAAGVCSITCVLPYYPYARQDIYQQIDNTSNAHMLANIFKAVGIDRVITFDLHTTTILEKSALSIEHVSCKPFWEKQLCIFIEKNIKREYVLVAPDNGAALRVQSLADSLGLDVCFVSKRRVDINQAIAIALSGNVLGKYALIVDDIIDTGRTAVSAAQLVLRHGALGVSGFFTHGVLSATSLAVMQAAPFDVVLLSDTFHPSALAHASIKYESIAQFIVASVISLEKKIEILKTDVLPRASYDTTL